MADILATVKEQSVAYLTVNFYDKNGVLAAPTSATWQVHDVESGSVLQAEAAMLPIASSFELTLTSAINTLIKQVNKEETRRVTIKAVFGVGLNCNAEYDYEVRSLEWVT